MMSAVSGYCCNRTVAVLHRLQWVVFFADERCVGLDSADSNFKGCDDALFSKAPGMVKENIHAINAALGSPKEMAEDYQQRLLAVTTPASGPPVLDLVLLGLGPDGHTASLFPGHPLLAETERWVAEIMDSPKPPPERITLTYPVINAARQAAFVAAGAGKADTLKEIFGDAKGDDRLPAARVAAKDTRWFVDQPAAVNVPAQKQKGSESKY